MSDTTTYRTKFAPVFVVGSGRCGTTILDQSIGLHSQFCSFPFESQIFVKPDMRDGLLCAFRKSSGSDRDARIRAHLEDRFAFRHNGQMLGFCEWTTLRGYRRLVEDLLHDLDRPAIAVRTFLDRLYAPYLEMTGARGWVDGTPAHGCVINDILKVYPEARFIHPIRDGREVARSIVRKRWKGGSFEKAIDHWVACVSRIREFGRQIGPARYIETDFRELMEHPETEMHRLLRFIGVDMEPPVLSRLSPERAAAHKTEYEAWETDLLETVAPIISEEFGWIGNGRYKHGFLS